jgi:hypothetical protein
LHRQFGTTEVMPCYKAYAHERECGALKACASQSRPCA